MNLPALLYKYNDTNTQVTSQIRYVEMKFMLVCLEKRCNHSIELSKQNMKSYKNVITTARAQMSSVRQSNSTDCPPTPSTNQTMKIVCPKVNLSPK